MDIITDAQLLARIEDFIKAHEMTPSKFGREAMGDAALVFQLREGKRSVSLKNAERLGQYMSAYQPQAREDTTSAEAA